MDIIHATETKFSLNLVVQGAGGNGVAFEVAFKTDGDGIMGLPVSTGRRYNLDTSNRELGVRVVAREVRSVARFGAG